MAKGKKNQEPEDDGYEYVIMPRFAKRSWLGWINPNTRKHVNLIGEGEERMTSGSKKNPPKKVVYHTATQADLKAFWELGAMKVGETIVSNQKVVARIPREIKSDEDNGASN